MKVLFIRLDHIGDCFLTLPAIKEFKSKFPHSKISVLCKKNTYDIFQSSQLVDEIFTLSLSHSTNHYEKSSGVFEIIKTIWQLNKVSFDRIYNFRDHIVERFLMYFVRGRYQSSIKHLMYHYDIHIMKRNRLMLGHAFDYRVSGESDYIKLYTGTIVENTKESLKRKVEGKLLFHIGGSYMKKLPMKRLHELILMLKKDMEDIIIVKSPFDNLVFDDIDIVEIDSIVKWAYIAERARGCICFDSGPMHVAAAHTQRLFAIFGPTSVAYFGPKSKDQKVFKSKDYKEDFIPGMRFSFDRFGKHLQEQDLDILKREIELFFNKQP